MAERKTNINDIMNHLKDYINILRKNNFPIESAYLIGSYAKEDYDEWSDIDVVLVSKCFAGIRLFDKDKIRRLTLDFD